MRRALPVIAGVYLLGVLAMATIGVIAPALARHAAALGVEPAAIGLGIALFSAPGAVLAAWGGGLIDRLGVRRCLIAACGIGAGGELIAASARGIAGFDAGLLVAGTGYAGIAVAGPAVLMGALDGAARLRGMAFWATYAPTGFSVGLLIAAAFVDGPYWAYALPLHAALLAAGGAAAAFLLPAVRAPASAAPRPTLRAMLRDGRVVRLGIAVALPNAISYGTGLAAPAYLARVHGLSLAASASGVAVAKLIAMLAGGVVTGALIARRGAGARLFAGVALLGVAAQALIFWPGGGIGVATIALIAWLFAFGGMAGTGLALLPGLIADPRERAAASGVVNQCISLASFAAPPVWLALRAAPQFVGLAALLLLASVAILPRALAAPRGRVQEADGQAKEER